MHLGALGRPTEGLTAIEEAATIYRQLGLRADLAMALSNLALRLNELGRTTEAARMQAEAVELEHS